VKQVLHVGKFYPPVAGGMERVLEMLCSASAGLVESRALVASTASTTVVEEMKVPAGGLPLVGSHTVGVTRVGTIGAVGSVHLAPSFAWHLRAARPDLIVLHEPNPWALLSYAIARPAAPLVIWYHSDVVRPALQYALFYAPLARFAYGRAERIVVSSPALAAHAAVLAPYQKRIRVVPFGIDAAAWTVSPTDRDAIGGDPGCAGEPFVLFAGRHVAYKGVDVLLRAMQQVDVRVVIAGDGPERGEWQRLAAELGLTTRANFVGEVSDARLRRLMQSCAALVLPSVTRAEAFGYVQLEAMACAKPVISTDVESGVSWVNQHDRTGLVVRAGDPSALATALRKLMTEDRLRAAMGEAGRQRVEREFSMVRLRERLQELYAELGLVEAKRVAC
jgi:rhamnosyl/mannosyltransferase